MLEEAFQQYMRNLSANIPTNSRRELDGGRLLVDFKELKVYKPKERLLRRSYRSGVELLFETYCNRRLIHARLNKLQIDNQLEDCVFPVVFAPVPPPRSIATESIPHPFVEISIVELVGQQTDVKQYEYFKLLVQECHFRADMSLINGVGSLLANESDLVSELEHKHNVELDILSAKRGKKNKKMASV
jgi:vacuolar protein sorting-associated protein 13A/C